MTLQVQCPQCSKQFKVKPELAGKRVKCSQCQAVITIPGAPATAPAGAAPQRPAPQQRPPAQQRPPVEPYSMPAPMQPAAPAMASMMDLLGDSKLGNFKEAAVARQGEMLCPACQEVAPMGAAICVKCGLDFRDGKIVGFEEEKKANPKAQAAVRAMIAGAIIVVALGVSATFVALIATNNLGFLSNPVKAFTTKHKDFPIQIINFGYAGLFVGGVLMVLFTFSLLADAFKVGKGAGLMFLFVPGYALFFVATHWKESRMTFFAYIMGVWILGFGLLIQMNSPALTKIVDPTKKKKEKGAVELPWRMAEVKCAEPIWSG